MEKIEVREEKIRELIKGYPTKDGILIPILQDIQRIYGYVPEDAVSILSKELGLFPVEIYGILTFYAQFYLEPRGKHTIKVCQGTACHVMGGKDILDHLSSELKVGEGETTDDGLFTLERVACLGCCGMAPVVVIDDRFYGCCTIKSVDKLIEEVRAKESVAGGE
ncbi:MAG: NADH-quinone oxidoreductase subunit NuoE [Candidatus Coatesbacteria bacterium]|nr:MAG: NADH-quinone oxidoreductase subunit NuoE [Candidatus Coatesbacteria bacterium]RLC41098.1 MAG: NADH-quinone oxidoreductase subunit NuoE [Candidatus Coatesbacteria bacterium]RLC42051.1 MAG: NADH-quinone oxidoreductase subunit NuoE [Candidatus Coatesbacteria bacterium]HEC80072.1 NADH-quinone oxidoreductase subunit NuoE [Bacillota bacterium]